MFSQNLRWVLLRIPSEFSRAVHPSGLSQSSDVPRGRILGFFPYFGKSHYFFYNPIMQALALRGHDVHVFSHFPPSKPLRNYTHTNLAGSLPEFSATDGITFDMYVNQTIKKEVSRLTYMAEKVSKLTLALPQVQKLLHSNEKYDVVITELFITECFIGFAHKFQAPHIDLCSSVLLPWTSRRFGNPDHPAYIANIAKPYSSHMRFKERLINTVYTVIIKYAFRMYFERPAQRIADEYFGKCMPSIRTLTRDTSLMLVNSYPSLNGVRPMVPAIVEVGGLHIKPLKKLPEDLQRWLDEATCGVVYFSLGSMFRSDSLPADKLAALLQAFGELPQRVLWKWESDTLPGQPDNVHVAKWLPQRDILYHPNVRVFMSHGGLLGMIEAVASAVPMVLMPIFADQHHNCKTIESKGVAVVLKLDHITKESVLKSITTVLKNPRYQCNANRLSFEYLDRPSSALDTATFWVEYVIRHKGTRHLRSAAVDLPWYKYFLLDVALVLLAGAAILVLAVYVAVTTVASKLGEESPPPPPSLNTNKIK